MVRIAPISRNDFVAWLEANRDNVVGWGCSFDDCPIMRAVVERGEYVAGAMHPTSAVLYKPGRRMKYEWALPTWARGFIQKLDAMGENVITGAEAMECLREPWLAEA